MKSRFLKFVTGVALGIFVGVMGAQMPFANAAVGAVLDTINRAYFVALSNYTMTIGTSGTGAFTVIAAKTPVATVDTTGIIMASGKNVSMAVYVPTLAATPVQGTNNFAPGLNVIPTNAANNAGILGSATPVAGQEFTIVNASGASQRIKAGGGATLNGATAGGYIVLASLASVRCYSTSATNYNCEQPVIPTPSGP